MPSRVRSELDYMLAGVQQPKAGLCVSVLEDNSDRVAGRAQRDLLWYAGYLVVFVQLVVATILWIAWKEWEVVAITAADTVLTFVSASLLQWSRELWACRRQSSKTVYLNQDNGGQYALVIVGAGRGLDFEDLAGGSTKWTTSAAARPVLIIVTVLWVALLITVSGIKEHTSFFVGAGGLGTIYTVLAAGAPRRPEAFGVPLKFVNVYVQSEALKRSRLWRKIILVVGESMVRPSFPGELQKGNVEWWTEAKHKEEMATWKKKEIENNKGMTLPVPR